MGRCIAERAEVKVFQAGFPSGTNENVPFSAARDFGPEPYNLHYAYGLFLVLRAGDEIASNGLRADLMWFTEGRRMGVRENWTVEGEFDPKKWGPPLG
jgi:hypothetical protein